MTRMKTRLKKPRMTRPTMKPFSRAVYLSSSERIFTCGESITLVVLFDSTTVPFELVVLLVSSYYIV
jgi:hypothetical protein